MIKTRRQTLDAPTRSSRRWPWLVVGFLLLTTASTMLTRSVRGKDRDCGNLGSMEAFALGTVISVPCVPAYVVNTTGQPVVWLARSTHLENEPIRWDSKRKVFVGLHEETFDSLGKVKTGPALRPLRRCPTEVRDGRLWIDVEPGSSSRVIVKQCQL